MASILNRIEYYISFIFSLLHFTTASNYRTENLFSLWESPYFYTHVKLMRCGVICCMPDIFRVDEYRSYKFDYQVEQYLIKMSQPKARTNQKHSDHPGFQYPSPSGYFPTHQCHQSISIWSSKSYLKYNLKFLTTAQHPAPTTLVLLNHKLFTNWLC